MTIDPRLEDRIRGRLEHLYGDRAGECLEKLLDRLRTVAPHLPQHRRTTWDQRDVVLITYGDQIRRTGTTPLACLREFLAAEGLDKLLSTVHVLPFFPYSSDDGFSVIDYRTVDPALGDWSDIEALGRQFELMFDLVLNHCSRGSRWFQEYVAGNPSYTSYFIEVDPRTDLSMVTRPRSLPLLTPVETSRGTRHLWTTFSEDQIDLNFADPDVLVEMLDVLLFYVSRGARILRLDAIAYLWKEPDTACIHLPRTHTVVKLMRDLTDAVAPGTILLTETNVPHEENVSYFGDGDEAHMVYQFSLAPLMLEALLSGNAELLVRWLAELEPSPPGTTVLNFTASHDGIGVRPLEGIMPPERFNRLLRAVKDRGGHVGTKQNPDGTESPYELNITYFDALAFPDQEDPALHARRFLAGQALMLALRGIPGIYFHSLIGTPNDTEGVQRTGRARSINRKKFDWAALQAVLDAPGSMPGMVLDGYRRLLEARIAQAAFHPDAAQEVIETNNARLVGFLRTSLDGRQRILVLGNVSGEPCSVDAEALTGWAPTRDLLGQCKPGRSVSLEPYQVAWLVR